MSGGSGGSFGCPLVLGADIGTHGVRTFLFDGRGRYIASARSNYERDTKPDGTAEQDPEQWWEGFCRCLQSLKNDAGSRGGLSAVAAIGITHQRGTVVPVNKDGRALAPAVCDSDTRCRPQTEEARRDSAAQTLYHSTGMPPFPFVGFYKIDWFKKERRKVFSEAASWYSPQDFIVRRLVGEERVSAGSLSRLGLLDIQRSDRPSAFAKERLEIEYPSAERIVKIGGVLGEITTAAAKRCGLAAGAKVVACAGDQSSALAAVSARENGDLATNLGTSFVSSMVVDRPVFDTKMNWTVELSANGKWALDIGSGCGTNVLDWFARTMRKTVGDGGEDWDRLSKAAARHYGITEGLFVVPLWWKATGKSPYGAILGLETETGEELLFLSILEGLAFEVKKALEDLTAGTGQEIRRQFLFGGASANTLFIRLLSDLLERELSIPAFSDASAVGAAASAAAGAGIVAHQAELVKSFSSKAAQRPVKGLGDYWKKKYRAYLKLREALPVIDFSL
jgi:sugar (pentulose or hexulose) kinase